MSKQEKDGCRQAPGVFRPVVDPARCEGKAACVSVCPVGVFEIARIETDIFRALPLRSKMKVWVHGMKTAATPQAAACEACGHCVTACPEDAIRLERVG